MHSRRILTSLAVAGATVAIMASNAAQLAAGTAPSLEQTILHERAMVAAVPAGGHRSKIALADSIIKLVEGGIIDPQKIEAVYASRGGVPTELKAALSEPSSRPILVTRENAGYYVNLLWAVGLANRMSANNDSPLNGPMLSRLASTGGWRLGKEANGAAYFNRFPIVALTAEQETLLTRVARSTFRPCCDNSTFFQDCNHGSALLGLLALGANQGLNEGQLYLEALAFNSFWFPHHYAHIALYFKVARNVDWRDADPREVMSARYSSASGWRGSVASELQRRGLLPEQGGANCGV